MIHLETADQLYRGVAASKQTSGTIVVQLKDVVAALGPDHACSCNLKALAAEWSARRDRSPQMPAGGIAVSLSDLPASPGLDPQCPISGPVVLQSPAFVELPRNPLLAALEKIAADAADKVTKPVERKSADKK